MNAKRTKPNHRPFRFPVSVFRHILSYNDHARDIHAHKLAGPLRALTTIAGEVGIEAECRYTTSARYLCAPCFCSEVDTWMFTEFTDPLYIGHPLRRSPGGLSRLLTNMLNTHFRGIAGKYRVGLQDPRETNGEFYVCVGCTDWNNPGMEQHYDNNTVTLHA